MAGMDWMKLLAGMSEMAENAWKLVVTALDITGMAGIVNLWEGGMMKWWNAKF